MTYQLNADKILFTQLGEEGVVYDLEKNEYITLNETFFKIVQGIEQAKKQDEIVAALCDEYAIDAVTCEKEVGTAIDKLLAKEYILKA
jgi:hypothetical protein